MEDSRRTLAAICVSLVLVFALGSCDAIGPLRSTECCDADARPGFGDNAACFEGATCCADGTWACNEVDQTPSCEALCEVEL